MLRQGCSYTRTDLTGGMCLLCGLDLFPIGLFEHSFLPTFPTVEEPFRYFPIFFLPNGALHVRYMHKLTVSGMVFFLVMFD